MGEWKRGKGEVGDVMVTGGRFLQDESYIHYVHTQCIHFL